MSLQKFWSHSQVGLSTRWGPGAQGLCFKYPAKWELLIFRDLVFNLNGRHIAHHPPVLHWERVSSDLPLTFTLQKNTQTITK